MTEPPIRILFPGLFHTGAALTGEAHHRIYQRTAKQIAFRALTTDEPAARLVHVFRTVPSSGDQVVIGAWFVADHSGRVSAHRGQFLGQGGPWDLAETIIPGSRHAVQAPVLNGFYRDRPDAYQELVESYRAAQELLLARHNEAVKADHLYTVMQTHPDWSFLAMLRAAIGNRDVQLVFHDWLEEQGFPHADELNSKRWNRGEWTANQLLDLLSKPFSAKRRSFSGRTI
jgi:uncharacterized protein (TIGR02996 family)